MQALSCLGVEAATPAGLSVLVPLAQGIDDESLALKARAANLAPASLSPWFADPLHANSGLVLGVANVREHKIAQDFERLLALIGRR